MPGGIRFGTDGIRGVAGEAPIVPEVGFRLGAVVGRAGAVVVGRDPRPSGAALAAAVASGVRSVGGDVVAAGVVPTAAVQLAIADGLAARGVMITASHNPAEDNGFKVLLAGGRKPNDDEAAAIEQALADQPAGPIGDEGAADERVREGWLRRIAPLAAGVAGRRLVVDLANGSLSAHRTALEALLPGAAFVGHGGAINDGVGTEHLEALRAAVRAHGAGAGLAVDGDADRVRLVDADGREVPGDTLTWLLAGATGAKGLAVTVMSTTALEVGLPGVRVVRTPVGDRFLREAMERDGLPLGAEDSGHVLFADHPGGDGLFAGLRALAAAFARAPTVAEAVRGFEPFPRRLTKVKAAVRRPLAELPELGRAAEAGEAALGAGGRVFLRWSGTEPVLRVLVEGREDEAVGRVSAEVTATAARALS